MKWKIPAWISLLLAKFTGEECTFELKSNWSWKRTGTKKGKNSKTELISQEKPESEADDEMGFGHFDQRAQH